MLESGETFENRRSLFDEAHESGLNPWSDTPNWIEPATSPVPVRELIAVLLLVILCDVSIYRSNGYAGPSLLFVIAPVLLFLGITPLRISKSVWVLSTLLAFVSLRLIWCGSWLAVAAGFGLLICVAMSLVGIPPYFQSTCKYTFQLIESGFKGLGCYFGALLRFKPAIPNAQLFAVALPTLTLAVFASIFVMANPDLVTSVATTLSQIADTIYQWLKHFQFSELLFCLAAAWIAIGVLRPSLNRFQAAVSAVVVPHEAARSPYFAAYRNTLASLIGLFAVYLVFEFQTLWFKTFPKGFHYSGYAHEGAAWLTIALGLATLTLSLIFRAGILTDPRLPKLRILAWIWSIQNLVLAVAVFNRLFIYVGFNGMTRMRVVGLLGVASVVAGLLLVFIKIAYQHDFLWLIRRQLWAVSFAVYLYAVLPVDAFVNRFNVDRVMNGNLPPSVQISVHPTSDEGWLYLSPLIRCENITIRDGVRAMLFDKLDELELKPNADTDQDSDRSESRLFDWTSTQIARNRLREQLRLLKDELTSSQNLDQRSIAIQKFHDYAYQWY